MNIVTQMQFLSDLLPDFQRIHSHILRNEFIKIWVTQGFVRRLDKNNCQNTQQAMSQKPTASKWKSFFKKTKPVSNISKPMQETNQTIMAQEIARSESKQEARCTQTQIKQNFKPPQQNKQQEAQLKPCYEVKELEIKQTKDFISHQIQNSVQNKNLTEQNQKEQTQKSNVSLQPQIQRKKEELSLQTQKILSKLQQKQSIIKRDTNKINKIQALKESQLSEQKPEKNKIKPKTGHYKIFNPQHFDVKDQETKTSLHRWTYGNGQTPKQLLISSWNINGMRARMNNNDILNYIDNVKPDIFCVNQHKMDQKSYLQSPYKFWSYYSYWNFPKYSLGYSGVAIFSKYPAKQAWEDIHLPQHSKEGRIITLEFDKFILVHVYIPTIGRQLQRLDYRVKQFDPAFREYILRLKNRFQGKSLIICGDFNVAHHQLDCHTGKRMKQGKQPAFTLKQRNSFSLLLKQANLVDTYRHFYPDKRQYTWWNIRRGGKQRAGQTGIGKRLDYFLVDRDSMKYVKSSEMKPKVKGCDHCPIELLLKFD